MVGLDPASNRNLTVLSSFMAGTVQAVNTNGVKPPSVSVMDICAAVSAFESVLNPTNTCSARSSNGSGTRRMPVGSPTGLRNSVMRASSTLFGTLWMMISTGFFFTSGLTYPGRLFVRSWASCLATS
uniref:(northern house mosquito) hypothetical protein n=1 Tax=Culex pipiens TaxID=7175 RepID=A0A8D8CDJ3_CULPI